MDIDGWEAAAITAALLNVLCNAGITPQEVERTGISLISEQEIEAARAGIKVI